MMARLHTNMLYFSLGILVLIITCFVYSPGLSGPFVFDDLTNILLNPDLHNVKLTLSSLKDAALSNDSGPLKRPLAMLTFALNAAWSEFDPFHFKVTNLVIHLVNGLLVYWLSYLIITRYNLSSSAPAFFDSNLVKITSLAVSSIWLLHPINVTSVLYIVQRMNSLSVMFMLLTLINYVLLREKILAHKKRLSFLFFSLPVLAVLAVLSKETALLLPIYLLLIEIFIFRFTRNKNNDKQFYIALITFILLPIITGLLYFAANIDTIINFQHRGFTLTERLLTESRIIWIYLYLIFIPNVSKMGLYHDDLLISHNLIEPVTTLFSIIGLIIIVFLSIFLRRKSPLISFGIAWFLFGHSLESTVFPLELMHEHRNYLPQYGLILCTVYYYIRFIGRSKANSNESYARISILPIYILLTAYGTYARAQHWSSEPRLAIQEAKAHPESIRTNTYLAATLHKNKRYDAAAYYFVKAVNLDPNNPNTRIRLAQHLYSSTGTIPDDLIDEIANLLKHNLFSRNVILTFDPLLLTTVGHPATNNRIIHLYQNYLNRKDIKIPVEWRIYAYKKLSYIYKKRGNINLALSFLRKIKDINDTMPYYYLETAEILIRAGQYNNAKELLDRLQSSNIILKSREQNRFEKLLTKLTKTTNRINTNKKKVI